MECTAAHAQGSAKAGEETAAAAGSPPPQGDSWQGQQGCVTSVWREKCGRQDWNTNVHTQGPSGDFKFS